MEILVYFEGNAMLRTGFKQFFSELELLARGSKSTIDFVAAKDGPSFYRKACRLNPGAWNILLKDSEQPMSRRPADLCRRHGIGPASAGNVFWMVELMEAWFLADPDAVASYYVTRGLSAKALVGTEDVERIPKVEVMKRIKRATKGKYNKVTHAPYLLARLDPKLVQQRAQHCRAMFESVKARLEH